VSHPRYDPHEIESRRQAAWRERDAFATPPADPGTDRPRRYIKPSAPFTSGNIHIGHVRSYSIGDAYARYQRARGEDVLFAFGFDAFGLPAELVAIERGIPAAQWVASCAEHMRGQLERLGYSFDWERAFMSSDAQMYRWSQWLFLTFLKAGLIYQGTGAVDWCDTCQTTLASIQVEPGGLCWRCHNPVRLIQREQWCLRISPYLHEADEHVDELLAQNGMWDEVALASQRFVLGRVDGWEIELEGANEVGGGGGLTAFTPYEDGVAHAKFVLLSPRHPDAERYTSDARVRERLEDLRSGGLERDERDAEAIALIDTGHTLASPAGAEPLPVLISPIVDGRYGPTAILGVPERDKTDDLIAKRLGLPGAQRADGSSVLGDGERGDGGDGGAGAAGVDAGNASPAGPTVVGQWPASGQRPAVRYRANDFSISRQRSWGTPIPIVYCDQCGTVPVPEAELPVLLPLDLTPTGTGNPLAEREDFVNTTCPTCGGQAKRETDTLDCHFDALWLWVPVCVPPAERDRPLGEIFALEDLRAWLPCERVVAGSDSGNFVFDQRITTMALRDIGPLQFLTDGEPFAGCLFHEMVIADGRKMSKHLGNVVDPDELVERYGADTARLATLYAAGPQRTLNWSDSAVLRCHRFLNQVWDFAQGHIEAAGESHCEVPETETRETPLADEPRDTSEHLRVKLAQWCETAVVKTSEDMDRLEMHKAVRNVMRLFDRVKDYEKKVGAREEGMSPANRAALLEALGVLAQMLCPFAPHIAEELWIGLGNDGDTQTPWPGVSSAVPA
jgi:leucyl-tRNA synthetase